MTNMVRVPGSGSKPHARLMAQHEVGVQLVAPPNRRALEVEAKGHTLSYCLNGKCPYANTGGGWVPNDMDILQTHCYGCNTKFQHNKFQTCFPAGQKLARRTFPGGPSSGPLFNPAANARVTRPNGQADLQYQAAPWRQQRQKAAQLLTHQ